MQAAGEQSIPIGEGVWVVGDIMDEQPITTPCPKCGNDVPLPWKSPRLIVGDADLTGKGILIGVRCWRTSQIQGDYALGLLPEVEEGVSGCEKLLTEIRRLEAEVSRLTLALGLALDDLGPEFPTGKQEMYLDEAGKIIDKAEALEAEVAQLKEANTQFHEKQLTKISSLEAEIRTMSLDLARLREADISNHEKLASSQKEIKKLLGALEGLIAWDEGGVGSFDKAKGCWDKARALLAGRSRP